MFMFLHLIEEKIRLNFTYDKIIYLYCRLDHGDLK